MNTNTIFRKENYTLKNIDEKHIKEIIRPIKNYMPILSFNSSSECDEGWKSGYYAACNYFLSQMYGSNWKEHLR